MTPSRRKAILDLFIRAAAVKKHIFWLDGPLATLARKLQDVQDHARHACVKGDEKWVTLASSEKSIYDHV